MVKPWRAPVHSGTIRSALLTRVSQWLAVAWHGVVSQFSSSGPASPAHEKKVAAAAAAAGVTKRVTHAPESDGVDAVHAMPRSVCQATVAADGSHAAEQPAVEPNMRTK